MSNTFSLRKLELAQPWLEAALKGDQKAFVQMAALSLADEGSLKLFIAGNKDILQPFIDQAYDMDPEAVAALLSNFIAGSKRFSLIVSGLSVEEVNQLQSLKMKTLKQSLGLELLEN